MLRLIKLKEKQKEISKNSNGKPPVKKQSAGELRLHKGGLVLARSAEKCRLCRPGFLIMTEDPVSYFRFDISELNLPVTTTIAFPNGKDDLMNFEVTLRPDEGYYLGGSFIFTFQVSPMYPHEAPKVKCKTKVYHPNIDLEGNVCLNILREDWKPVLNVNTIIYGLLLLFMQPNHEDPLNHEAAAVLRDNPKTFGSNVRRAMSGGYVGETSFQRCM
ncbi:hypothetical protein GIB67_017411 [Kingdonia uniflora]|uniref:UBC core domain-containing protein n=1 Tax=Kingdonia uniflora TaxID=39325 RepID=A0A7J7M4I4_9MAGN|nr:hypothetical protein GIB67_017411 [Kingdonia uniflora]